MLVLLKNTDACKPCIIDLGEALSFVSGQDDCSFMLPHKEE